MEEVVMSDPRKVAVITGASQGIVAALVTAYRFGRLRFTTVTVNADPARAFSLLRAASAIPDLPELTEEDAAAGFTFAGASPCRFRARSSCAACSVRLWAVRAVKSLISAFPLRVRPVSLGAT
jgi:NAD(P)-dependent dehydrogenase (short-subunit alcohol dehydrogenase family)